MVTICDSLVARYWSYYMDDSLHMLVCCWFLRILTHWGRDQMAAIFQTTFSNAFSWIKLYEFGVKFRWSLFLKVQLTISLWDRKRTQWATWGLIRTKKDSFWVGRLKWSHCWSQMVSFWVAVRKLLPLGARLVSFWMVGNHRVSNRLTWSQLVLFWVAYRKAPPQRTKMASFWVVWFPCG